MKGKNPRAAEEEGQRVSQGISKKGYALTRGEGGGGWECREETRSGKRGPKNGSSVRSERHIQGCRRGENRMMGSFK